MWKTSENVFLGHLRGWVFHIFPRLHSIMKGRGGLPCPTIPFRIFVDHVAVCNILRWSSLWQKIVNGWKLLLIVLTWRFVVNVTELLDLTLKCINEFRLRQYSNPSAIYMFKVSKKTLQQCVKYMKVNSKDTGTMYGASIVNFEHFCILF